MIPIVFCASLPPCEYESSAELEQLRRPEDVIDACRVEAAEDPVARHHQREAGEEPTSGEITMKRASAPTSIPR